MYRTESSLLLDIDLPADALINICGDIHGQVIYILTFRLSQFFFQSINSLLLLQLYDLIKIFKLQGPPSATNYYLFNGDIVDKGQHSVEVSDIDTLLSSY